MGYPTSASATERSRQTTSGLSQRERLALLVPVAGAPVISPVDLMPYRDPGPVRTYSRPPARGVAPAYPTYKPAPGAAASEAAFLQEIRDLVGRSRMLELERAAKAAFSQGLRPVDLGKWLATNLGPLRGAVPSALLGLLTSWLMDELGKQLNPGLQPGPLPAKTWTWPDPAKYGPGSSVNTCAGASPDIGPFPGQGWCGTIANYRESDIGVGMIYDGAHPEAPVEVYWELADLFDPEFSPGVPAVYARYVGTPTVDPDTVWPTQVQPPRVPTRPPATLSPAPASPTPYPLIPHWTPPGTERGNDLPGRPNGDRRPPRRKRPPRYRPPRAHRPPARGTKEIKAQGRLGWLLGKMMGVTEVVDFIQAMWEALPRQYQTRGWDSDARSRANQMFRDLYKHWQDIDPEIALENFIINQIEDAIIGMIEGNFDKVKKGVWKDPTRPYGQNRALSPEYHELVTQFVRDYIAPWVREGIQY